MGIDVDFNRIAEARPVTNATAVDRDWRVLGDGPSVPRKAPGDGFKNAAFGINEQTPSKGV